MSEKPFISLDNDKSSDTLRVHIGYSEVRISGLRIAPMSSFVTPHQLIGIGNARIALTDLQLVELLAEWLRFVLHDDAVHVQSEDTKLKFECWVKR